MMWELISLNRRKSFFLFVGMAILLVLLGHAIGSVFIPENGGLIGTAIAVALWGLLTLISLHSGDRIILKVSGAKEVTKDAHPQLFNVVEEMKIAAGLPAMPKVYVIDEAAPNAFAIGLKPEKSAIGVTAGLLARLNRDELQGVVAHETAHIVNRDSQFMTVAGIMLGAIVLLSQVFLRSWWFMPGSSRRYRKSDSGGSPQMQLIMIVVAVLLAILAPIFARLLYLAISRKREYLADATAVQLTRYPEGLASALEKISGANIPLEAANKVTAPMFIVNPLIKKGNKLSSLDSTHPPMHKRIKVLRAMSQGADYRSYQRAFSKVEGKPTPLIPGSGIKNAAHIDIREASVPDKPQNKMRTTRDAMDLMRAVNGYAFLMCACGLKIKLPPEMPDPSVECPKCGRENHIPAAEMAKVGELVGAVTAIDQVSNSLEEGDFDSKLEYTRRGKGWETFECACHNLLQISPAFNSPILTCRNCDRKIRIKE